MRLTNGQGGRNRVYAVRQGRARPFGDIGHLPPSRRIPVVISQRGTPARYTSAGTNEAFVHAPAPGHSCHVHAAAMDGCRACAIPAGARTTATATTGAGLCPGILQDPRGRGKEGGRDQGRGRPKGDTEGS